MAESRPQKFRKSIFEVEKSNFLFDSINVSGMYCNLSNTFKRVIFTFLKLWHTAKATFADSTKLKMAENRPQKFRKSIFEVEKSNFLFDSMNVSGMYWNLSNTFKRVIFTFLTENPFTQRSESQIREQHNEIEFFRMTFWIYEDFAK